MTSLRTTFRNNLKQYMMLIALIALVFAFQFLTKGVLLKPMNVSNLIFQNAYVVILAVGMLLCILTGGNIDSSVGSVVALVGPVPEHSLLPGDGIHIFRFCSAWPLGS